MEAPPPLEAVYDAVETLYKSPTDKEKASQWLADLQNSVYAWKIADEMLREKRNLESCYFAAQTMRSKIQYSFPELPPESHISLRDSLMEHLDQVTDSTGVSIVTQLSLAIATLALQMSRWEKPVLELMARYNDKSTVLLLEILTVLPEEVDSRYLRLGTNRRKQVKADLMNCSPTVANYLKMCIAKSNGSVQIECQALKCLASWVNIGAIDIKDTPDLINHVFTALAITPSTEVHDAATECLCSLLLALETHNASARLIIGRQLYEGVVSLEQHYHMSVARENISRAISYCRIFTELAEALLEDILKYREANQPHYAAKVFDLVLMCVGNYDYEVAEITFNFWCRFSEELYKKENENLNLCYKPYVERLIASLCRHSRIEPDLEGLLDEGEDFYDFRAKVAELIKDVVFIVGSSNCFRQMYLDLQSPDVTWDASEAALFVMQAVAKNLLPDENDVVPKVVEAILNLPLETHVAVKHTSVLLLGELSDWIDKHPQSLEPTLQFLLICLQQPLLASAAATSLTSICLACRNTMVTHLPGLVQVVEALDNLAVKQQAANGLLRGVASVLSGVPSNELEVSLRKMCQIQLSNLVQLTKNQSSIQRGTRSDPSVWLDRLSAILRYLDLPPGNGQVNPVVAVFSDMWPVLSAVCEYYHAEGHVVERWCRCVRFAIRAIGRQSGHFLDPLVKQIVTIYSMHRHSSFLYLGSILVDECASEPHYQDKLLEMLSDLIQPTFLLLQETNGLKNHPDTVEDFFRLTTRFLTKLPFAFLQCPALPSILECALMCCSLDHRDANAAVMNFFNGLVTASRGHDPQGSREQQKLMVQHILDQVGKRLVNNLIQASVFSLQSYMLTGVTDVLWDLMDYDRSKFIEWLQEALSALPTQSTGGVVTATEAQLDEFLRSVTRARHLKEVCHLLREFARLYR